MSVYWWKNIASAISGDMTPQQAMDRLAEDQDRVMGLLRLKVYTPKLNNKKDPEVWLKNHERDRSPKYHRNDDAPLTIPYGAILERWRN